MIGNWKLDIKMSNNNINPPISSPSPTLTPTSLEDIIFAQILTNTYALSQVQRKIRILKEFFYQKLYTNQEYKTDDLRAEDLTYVKWIKTLDPKLVSQITQANFNQIFATLDSKVASLKVLLIYVAFDMPDPTITMLGALLRSSYGPQFLFDVRFDPSLLGGCALIWNGVYHDYSLKKSIDENKDKILGEIRAFIKH